MLKKIDLVSILIVTMKLIIIKHGLTKKRRAYPLVFYTKKYLKLTT